MTLLVQVVEHRYRPAVGAYQRRVHRLTRRVTHWLRLVDDTLWLEVPAGMLRRLDLCTSLAQARQLMTSARTASGGALSARNNGRRGPGQGCDGSAPATVRPPTWPTNPGRAP